MLKKCIISTYCLLLLAGCSQDSIIENPTEPINSSSKVSAVGAASIAGLNWADSRDNYVDGWIIPSGLTSADNYNTVAAKTDAVINGFTSNVSGVNTIRIGINPSTVSDSWWSSYQAVVDKATSKGFKVIIACWEGANSKNGKIDDETKFWAMWKTVVTKYKGNNKVYFEPFNEPYGYTLSQLKTIYKKFLTENSTATKSRIILDGEGYSEKITGIGADTLFKSCLLGLHNYAFWATRSVSAWRTDWRNRISTYGSRTVITEFGAKMNTGNDYKTGDQTVNDIAYIVATSDVCRTDKIASVYWPGLRDNDSYSLLKRGGTGNNITLSTVNASGVYRLRYGWNL